MQTEDAGSRNIFGFKRNPIWPVPQGPGLRMIKNIIKIFKNPPSQET